MGSIDKYTAAVHLANDIAPESRQSAVLRRLRLDVAQFIDAIVKQLDSPHAPVIKQLDA
jgi:hypothetical protein